MIKFEKNTRDELLRVYKEKKVTLEGNILKLISDCDDEEFKSYLEKALEKDKTKRKKRLEVTKKVQAQNTELTRGQKENDRVNRQLTKALEEAEESKQDAIRSKDEALKSKEEAEVSKEEAIRAKDDAERAREEAENAKVAAENDLEVLQKKTQFELISIIVKAALWVIVSVGVVTTAVFLIAMFNGMDTTIIGSTWSNIVGILLTNAFSIVGTIMGVKYATGKKSEE
jgi:nitrate reductase NapE component